MVAILKVLDKGHPGDKKEKIPASPSKVLERFSVDAHEIVASDPQRFEIVDAETPHDEDIQGNPVKAAKKPPKYVKNPAAGDSGEPSDKDE
jgi:hypothetical protein